MAEQQASSRFPWRIWHIPDPGPPIWEILEELGAERQRQVAQILVETQIATLEAQVSGLRGISEVLKAG